MIVIETERLLIKKIEKMDFRYFLDLHTNPTIMKYFDGGPKTIQESKQRFEEIMAHQKKYGFSYYSVFLKENNKYIGQTGLYYNYDMSLNLCYAFLEEFQGKGYATESIVAVLKQGFDDFNLSVVNVMSMPENKKSINMIEKLGGKFIREKILYSGTLAWCYDIKKEDFYNALQNKTYGKYRRGVGVILIDNIGLLYFFQRNDFDKWQGVEGGLENGYTALETAYKEIQEEIGINKDKLEYITETDNFYKYKYFNNEIKHGCIGQEKKFFLFRFLGNTTDFNYSSTSAKPEFKDYKLISYKEAINLVPEFKTDIYRKVFKDFAQYLR